jgi:sugar phosphate isomerase/epimerase
MGDVAATARSLRDAAKKHKKASRFHRRAAKECMEKLREICEAHNIKLSIVQGGGEHHGPEDIARADDGSAGKGVH